jgi:hypothetical protein
VSVANGMSGMLVPIFVMVHPALTQVAHDFLIPGIPEGADLSAVVLLIIAIIYLRAYGSVVEARAFDRPLSDPLQ